MRFLYSALEIASPIFGIKNIANKRILTRLPKEKKQIIDWPNQAKVAMNIQIDDLSARSNTNSASDFGAGKILKEFKQFKKDNPKLKFTLFTIPDPIFKKSDRQNHNLYKLGRYDLSKNRTWVSEVKKLGVEIALHGLHHVQTEKKYFFPYAEFEFKSQNKSRKAIEKGKEILEKAGFSPKGFKPPAWAVGHNKNLALIDVLPKFNFDYVCLSTPVSGLNQFSNFLSNYYPQEYEGMLNIPQNINLNWSWSKTKRILDQLISKNAVITMQAHFTPRSKEFTDGLDNVTFNKITKITNYVERKTSVWHAELQEIAEFWKNEHSK